MKRNILSVLAGLVVAIITFVIVETVNSSLHPIPIGLDFKDAVAVEEFYTNQPLSLWLVVLLGWLIGSFLCGILIKKLSKTEKIKLPIIAGSILTCSAIANFFSLPHPTWFIIVGLLVFIPSTLLGHRILKLKTNGL